MSLFVLPCALLTEETAGAMDDLLAEGADGLEEAAEGFLEKKENKFFCPLACAALFVFAMLIVFSCSKKVDIARTRFCCRKSRLSRLNHVVVCLIKADGVVIDGSCGLRRASRESTIDAFHRLLGAPSHHCFMMKCEARSKLISTV